MRFRIRRYVAAQNCQDDPWYDIPDNSHLHTCIHHNLIILLGLTNRTNVASMFLSIRKEYVDSVVIF
jgi:hypothetical protein